MVTKVVFLTHSAAAAGAEIALEALVGEAPREFEITVIFGQNGDMVERCSNAGSAVEVLPLQPGLRKLRRTARPSIVWRHAISTVWYSTRLRRLSPMRDADIVVARSLKALIYGRIATIGTGATFIWCLHDRLSIEYLGRAAAIWSRIPARLVDGIIVNSESTLNTVHTGSTLTLVCPPTTRVSVRDRSDPAERTTQILSLARLAPWKGQDVALRAFARAAGGCDVQLVVVGAPQFGEEDYANSLPALVTALGLEPQVTMKGHVQDPGFMLADSDILLHSSLIPEPFGLVVLEGMRAGCVVIATEPGGPSELIEDTRNGFLVPVGDEDALAEALAHVLSLSSMERSLIGRAAQEAAIAFDPTRITSEYLHWIKRVRCGDMISRVTRSRAWLQRTGG